MKRRWFARPWLYLAVAVAGLISLGVPAPARADNIDQKLLMKAKEIMKDLKKHEYKNVGVLKFAVERPGQKPSYQVGLINANMANRLENALILANDNQAPIGITHAAGEIAAKSLKGPVTDVATRQALFGLSYPLAWGDAKVQVDAFLTGTIQLAKDLSTTTVIIQAFEKKEPGTLREVMRFNVDTDRSVLTDLGQAFVSRSAVKTTDRDRDKGAVDDAARRNEQKPVEKPVIAITPPTALSVDLLDVQILYDGMATPYGPDRDNPAEMRVTEPREGQKVSFLLTNKSNKRLAVALRVNGQNTTVGDEENLQITEYTKWVLKPGAAYPPIEGFYNRTGKGVKPFVVLSDAATRETSLRTETRGLIQVDVWMEGGEASSEDLSSTRGISLRGGPITPPAGGVAKANSFKDAKKVQMDAVDRGLVMGGPIDSPANVVATNFDNPTYIGALTIRYYPK